MVAIKVVGFLIIGLQIALSALKVEEENVKIGQTENMFCEISEFEGLNYYLFCDTQLHEGAGGFPLDSEEKGKEKT